MKAKIGWTVGILVWLIAAVAIYYATRPKLQEVNRSYVPGHAEPKFIQPVK